MAGKPIEGFPNGLPDFTPKGVRITLENMIGECGDYRHGTDNGV